MARFGRACARPSVYLAVMVLSRWPTLVIMFIALLGCDPDPATAALERCTNEQAEAHFEQAEMHCKEALALAPDSDVAKQAQAKLDAMAPHLEKANKKNAKGPASSSTSKTAPSAKSSSAPTASVWDGVCERYALQCPGEKRKMEKCERHCTAEGYKKRLEMCSFLFCGVQTKKCDNEEAGDATIIACIEKRPWTNAR